MRTSSLVALCVVGAAALGGGWYFGTAYQPTVQTGVANGTLMFPGLAAHLAEAARIEITHQGATITLARIGDKLEAPWGLAQRGMYPVQTTALTELRLVEPRTSDPAQYGRLGLDDADQKTSTADLLRVSDAAGKPIAELLVGHRRVRTEGNVPDQVFVRRPGDAQTWLAEGSLQVDADPQLWLDRDVANIDHSRIATVVVHHGDSELDFAAKDGKLVLTAPANAPKLEDYKVDDLDRGLELLTFEDVAPEKDAAANKVGDPVGSSVFTTTDGLAVHVIVSKGEKDIWARLSATADGPGGTDKTPDKTPEKTPDKTKNEAAKLNAKWGGWIFHLGAWKQAALTPDLDALKAPPPAPTPAAAPAAPAPAPTAPAPATSAPAPTAPAAPASEAPAPAAPAPTAPSDSATPGSPATPKP
jgi:hypothetical protein